jgi:hypothetical protein
MGILLFLLTDDNIREMMKQGRGGAGRGPPKLPKGSLGLGPSWIGSAPDAFAIPSDSHAATTCAYDGVNRVMS